MGKNLESASGVQTGNKFYIKIRVYFTFKVSRQQSCHNPITTDHYNVTKTNIKYNVYEYNIYYSDNLLLFFS